MKKVILATTFVAIASLSLPASEPSAFGAGDLDNPSPYGLTSTEKTVLTNKQKLQKVVVKSNNQANEVESLRERIDGLQSVVESLSRKSQKNKTTLLDLENKNLQKLKSSDEYEKRLSEITQKNSEILEKNSFVIQELSKIVDNINTSYVSKDEFNDLVNDASLRLDRYGTPRIPTNMTQDNYNSLLINGQPPSNSTILKFSVSERQEESSSGLTKITYSFSLSISCKFRISSNATISIPCFLSLKSRCPSIPILIVIFF